MRIMMKVTENPRKRGRGMRETEKTKNEKNINGGDGEHDGR